MFKPTFDNYVICDQSGFKSKASQCRMQWNGLFVRKEFWDPKHPLLTLKMPRENVVPPIVRTGGPDVFVDPQTVNPLVP